MSTFTVQKVNIRAELSQRVRTYVTSQAENATCMVSSIERLAVAEAMSLGLTELGYNLICAEGSYTSAIEASRGHEKVLVIVNDGGEVTTDWVGLTDHRCVDRQSDLKEAVARHGVDLSETKASLHHDSRGGQTIAAAARQHAESLAEGAVQHAESLTQGAILHALTQGAILHAEAPTSLYERSPGQRDRVWGW